MEEGALTTQPPTVEEQMRGSEGGAFQERGFNYWSKRSPAEGRTCTLRLEETFSPPPSEPGCKRPVFWGAQGWAAVRFWGVGLMFNPCLALLPLRLGPAGLCAHRAKRAFVLGTLYSPHLSPALIAAFAILRPAAAHR